MSTRRAYQGASAKAARKRERRFLLARALVGLLDAGKVKAGRVKATVRRVKHLARMVEGG